MAKHRFRQIRHSMPPASASIYQPGCTWQGVVAGHAKCVLTNPCCTSKVPCSPCQKMQTAVAEQADLCPEPSSQCGGPPLPQREQGHACMQDACPSGMVFWLALERQAWLHREEGFCFTEVLP